MDGEGNLYSASIMCMEIERHLQNQKHAARLAMHATIAKDKRANSIGRISIQIIYTPGLPLLTIDEANQMLGVNFTESVGLTGVPLKTNGGDKLEGISNLSWAAYVSPHPKGAWPKTLGHPNGDPEKRYLYLIDTYHTKHKGLCTSCHQPITKSYHCGQGRYRCKVWMYANRPALKNPSQASSRPMRGYTTLEHEAQRISIRDMEVTSNRERHYYGQI
jgi:hypothetical protein